jgi:uncharacterized oligopeptide transporter (OPT) family protein
VIGEHAQLLSPTSQRWVGFAKLITRDTTAGTVVDPAAAARISWMLTSAAVGALIGTALTVLEQRKGWRNFIPSPTGMGIAMLIPVNAVTVIFVGAALDTIWSKVAPASHERYSIPIASGLIAGEALVAVAIPLLVTIGLMKLP